MQGAGALWLQFNGGPFAMTTTDPRYSVPQFDALIGRSTSGTLGEGARAALDGKVTMVTGAGGSIGSELVRLLARLGAGKIIMLDHDETNLQAVQMDLVGHGLLDDDRLVLANVRDAERMKAVMAHHRPDVVFHLAGVKHLVLLELYPCESVKTNVTGTRNVLEAAAAAGVTTFVNVSTVCAADPASVLGASKRVAESIVNAYRGPMHTTSVRLGTVLGSRGSFLPMLARNVESGDPVYITHPAVERYLMSMQEAAGLIAEAAALADQPGIFSLDMGRPVRMADIVTRYARLNNCAEPEVIFTGLRAGEKLSAVMISDDEVAVSVRGTNMLRTNAPAEIAPNLLLTLEAAAAADEDEAVRAMFLEAVPNYRAVVAA